MSCTRSPSFSRFADIDGDGDSDLVVGARDGKLRVFENTGSALEARSTVAASGGATSRRALALAVTIY